ncbi:hypothetical protein JF66_10025 [Cryobacterium sp. MLB-32]|uniref:hypothetical protein n=1 Tax=Cryobacterium sp. MLB-32 TaxID=1529318 RepID=UPI0004E6E161|nr:hypothetical protein [Cryobacterium sp. MLB-32]KFF59616.1 hypothetical protein JF66_10025 [Cryobacterium sp. MLB-32]
MELSVYWIPIVAIIGGITYSIFDQYFKLRRRQAEASSGGEVRAALAASNDLNTQLLTRLEGLDTRLARIERTLIEVG